MNSDLYNALSELFGNDDNRYLKNSSCRNIYSYMRFDDSLKYTFKRQSQYTGYFLGWGINKYSTPEKCFDYLFYSWHSHCKNRLPFLHYHKELFDKKISDLTKDEILELLLLRKSPSRYNRHLYPERFEKKILELKENIE